MNGECKDLECGLRHGISCDEGHPNPSECPHFVIRKAENPIFTVNIPEEEGIRMPWTGRALGLRDISLVSSRCSPTLVGVVGAFNAGKTAFLTSMFAHFSMAGIVGDYAFAGSYSLQAWERLKKPTEWPNQFGPGFPPHTPDSADRVPSLLHLTLRKANDPLREVLFTDAPGEWFSRWILNQSADNAQGARWIAEYATHFLFFIDREALAGNEVGKVKQETLRLARVLNEHRGERPIIVIWAKSDLTPDLDVESAIRDRLHEFFGEHPSFDLHVNHPSCLEVLEIILNTPLRGKILRDHAFGNATSTPFFAFRGGEYL